MSFASSSSAPIIPCYFVYAKDEERLPIPRIWDWRFARGSHLRMLKIALPYRFDAENARIRQSQPCPYRRSQRAKVPVYFHNGQSLDTISVRSLAISHSPNRGGFLSISVECSLVYVIQRTPMLLQGTGIADQPALSKLCSVSPGSHS